MITDFFGGVSQAEIFLSETESDTLSGPPLEDASISYDRCIEEPKVNSSTVFIPGDHLSRVNRMWKDIRKWTSVVILGVLVAWVAHKG